MWLVIILIIIPIIEIGLFIEIGSALGLWPTLGIVILTAILGSSLLRAQGLHTILTLQKNLQSGENPIEQIAHGALILVAGIVLVTPGFFTDVLGFCLLIPAIRIILIRTSTKYLVQRINTQNSQKPSQQNNSSSTIINGEFEIINDNVDSSDDSHWTNRKD